MEGVSLLQPKTEKQLSCCVLCVHSSFFSNFLINYEEIIFLLWNVKNDFLPIFKYELSSWRIIKLIYLVIVSKSKYEVKYKDNIIWYLIWFQEVTINNILIYKYVHHFLCTYTHRYTQLCVYDFYINVIILQ